jgi:hypothetical protein
MKLNVFLFLALLALFVVTATATGQVITVTISSDDIDIDWQTGTIDDLPGPDGEVSFSEALIAANNTPGHQMVGFAIPESEWTLQFLYPGRAVLTTITGYFWRADEEITIDGTTQTDFTGDTNPDGREVVIHGEELYLNGDDSVLLGFDSSSITMSGSNGRVEGNTGTMNITVYNGNGTLIKDNTGGTIKIDRSSGNIVVGNIVERVRVLGFGSGQLAMDNQIGGPNPEDRNFLTGYGWVNSEGLPSGTTVQLFASMGTIIENNWIGTTPDGMEQGNLAATIGVGLEGENYDTVIRNNRIAGILGHGQWPHHFGEFYGWAILVGGTGSGVTITGNTIGLNAKNQPMLGSVFGIDVGNSRAADIADIRIGGPIEGNAIAGHRFNGITVGHDVPQVRISGNTIDVNDALGIDLIPSSYGYGVSENDALDLDSGGNELQNFPQIDSARLSGSNLRVIGTLHSTPLDEFTIEFFASPDCDESGFGEGRNYLGFTQVVTDGAGDTEFDVVFTVTPGESGAITVTATLEPVGATSEFSPCRAIGRNIQIENVEPVFLP